ncbi:hypothetical protein KEM52_003397 [Ascosphaera acerosa]|nr:hypothetical protein KEM52_003397 [Ascosphaera acerosa]
MCDRSHEFRKLLAARAATPAPVPPSDPAPAATATDRPANRVATRKPDDQFLSEACAINGSITSLLRYLASIRQAYLSLTPRPRHQVSASASKRSASPSRLTSLATPGLRVPAATGGKQQLTEEERDQIDAETAGLIRDLSASISGLASAETLRHETQTTIIRKKFSLVGSSIWRWAVAGTEREDPGSGPVRGYQSAEHERMQEVETTVSTVRANVLWILRSRLQAAAEMQREMTEKRVERIKEKEKSILHKLDREQASFATTTTDGVPLKRPPMAAAAAAAAAPTSDAVSSTASMRMQPTLQEEEAAAIESQLTSEQLQLFADENEGMVRHYEDALNKARQAEKSLIEISSLQQTLVSHLTTQDEYITQLATDAENTQANVKQGNRELARAAERRSVARLVFYATVGLCASLVAWDAIF